MTTIPALFEGAISTFVEESETSTFSSSIWMSRPMFKCCVCPARIWTSCCVKIAKPLATAFRAYVPGTSPLNSYKPSRLVVVSSEAPLALVRRTAALAITPPEGSVTTPFSAPAGVCASKSLATGKIDIRKTKLNRTIRTSRKLIRSRE